MDFARALGRRRSGMAALAASGLGLLLAACAGDGTRSGDAPLPPVAARVPYQVPSPNGPREDDYYWIRDDTRQSPAVLDDLNAEDTYRDAMMRHTEPLQQKLYAELSGRIKPDDATVPVLDHNYWYYRRYEAGKDYPIYARRAGVMSAPEQILLDGNALAAGQPYFEIGDTAVSPDGKFLAFAEDDVGRRQYTLKVKNLATGELLADRVTDIEPDLVWANDNATVLYVAKDPVTLLSVRAQKHVLGTDAGRDALVYEESDHSYYLSLSRSKSEKYLFIQLASTQQTEWRYADASDHRLAFKPVLAREPNLEYQVDHVGHDFIIRTNWQAPNFRIVRVPVSKCANKQGWKDVVAGRDDTFVESFAVFKDYIAVNERSGGLLKIHVQSWYGGSYQPIKGEEPAYSAELVDTPGLDSASVRYVYTSLTTPPTTYEYNMREGTKTLLKISEVPGYDAGGYVTEYLHAPARDGLQVPVSVVYKKGTKLDGSAPLYQYGYGSYGYSTDPEFEPDWVSLMDRGFVVAIAHVRGGEELGRGWYEDGKLFHKMNTFTDFVDVTEYLVKSGYGAKDKVFAEGRSAGGLLMGAVANLAPHDYRGMIVGVPFVDVVTTMLDESIPLTTNEFDEWGNPKERDSYDYMLGYSPYDNVKAQDYPAMFVSTALWDSQVQYYEPAKWVAKLRALKTDHNPLILSVDMAAGHSGKSGRFQRAHDTAREYAFVLDQLGISQ